MYSKQSVLGPTKSDTEFLTVRHLCDISLKEAVLLGRKDAEMGTANLIHVRRSTADIMKGLISNEFCIGLFQFSFASSNFPPFFKTQKKHKSLLYLLNCAKACNEFAGPISASMPGASPDFRFLPPDSFLAPLSGIFFGRKKLLFLGGKNVKICDFGQKKPSDFAKTFFFFFFFFFWRSPAFGRKIC